MFVQYFSLEFQNVRRQIEVLIVTMHDILSANTFQLFLRGLTNI